MGKVDAHDVADGERPYNDGCPEEHPLVDGEERILRQQVLEERQVEGEGKLSRHTEQVAPDVSHLGIASRSTCHDDDDGTSTSHQYTERLLPGDRLLQYQEGENHGEDRHRGGHDAGIARRGHVQTDGVRTLVEHEGKESCSSKLEDVFYWNMLFLGEERGEPEENGATQYAEAHQVDAVDAVKHGILAYGSHQSPECTGTEEAQVGDKRSFVIHFSLFLFKSSLF